MLEARAAAGLKSLETMQKEYEISQSSLIQLKKEKEDFALLQTKAESSIKQQSMHKIAELTDQLEKSKAQVKKDEMILKVKVEEKSKIEKKLNSTQAKLN